MPLLTVVCDSIREEYPDVVAKGVFAVTNREDEKVFMFERQAKRQSFQAVPIFTDIKQGILVGSEDPVRFKQPLSNADENSRFSSRTREGRILLRVIKGQHTVSMPIFIMHLYKSGHLDLLRHCLSG